MYYMALVDKQKRTNDYPTFLYKIKCQYKLETVLNFYI